jgi:Ca2+-binding EF-hand superfamily protein
VNCGQVVDLRDEFQRIDSDSNGSLSYPEFSGALMSARSVVRVFCVFFTSEVTFVFCEG